MFARSAMRALRPGLARTSRRFGAPAEPVEVAPVAEKDMWHKQTGAGFVFKEIGRADFMPFFVGLTCVRGTGPTLPHPARATTRRKFAATLAPTLSRARGYRPETVMRAPLSLQGVVCPARLRHDARRYVRAPSHAHVPPTTGF